MKLLPLFFFNIAVIFFSEQSFAAACCGGGFATPSLISGDDKAQLTTSYSVGEVTESVDARGVWKKWDEHQKVQTFRIDGAHLISDRWQAGFTLPVIQRSYSEQTHSGLGDTSAAVAYEYLPDWDYHPYRPKGIGFMQLTLPTGKSKAESENGGLDSRGNGFWALGVGTLLTKIISHYDLYSSFEVHRSFGKKFSNSQVSGTLNPGWGGNFTLGGGYSFLKVWRAGTAITWSYEDPLKIQGNLNSKGFAERYATATLNLSYLIDTQWAGTLSYTDQTVFGNPVNTSLAKTVLLQIQRRWER